MLAKVIGLACAGLLIMLGSIVLLGWAIQSPSLVQIIPGMIAMVPNTAINFVLLGMALMLSFTTLERRDAVQKYLFLTVFISSVLCISQDIFHYSSGMDHLFETAWVVDPNPTPGRMAPNTSLAFILSALVGLLTPYANKYRIAYAIQLLTLMVFLIAIVGMLIYSLKMEYIFSWYRYTRMAVHTASGMTIVSITLWLSWQQSPSYKNFYHGKEDKKIIFGTAMILLCITLFAGLGSIASLAYVSVVSFNQSLEVSLHNKISTLVDNIESIHNKVILTFSNPLLLNAFQGNKNAELQESINYLEEAGYSIIELRNAKGELLYSKGNFISKPDMAVRLKLPYDAVLSWKNGFWLKFNIPIQHHNSHVILGYVTGEAKLSEFSEAYQNYQYLGETGETIICKKGVEETATCFPTRFTPNPFTTKLVLSDKLLPIAYTFSGGSGVINAFDYQGQNVISAYSPINSLGLGMVLKIHTTEIYKPIREKIEYVLPRVIFLILCGLILLAWQVVPLLRKVILSEQQALEVNKKLAQQNKEIYCLRELSSSLQSCLTLDEAVCIISQQVRQLLPKVAGSLFLMHSSRNYLESITSWGHIVHTEKLIKPEDCWALRRGSVYRVDDTSDIMICAHTKMFSKYLTSYVCVPMLAQSDLIGLLYIEWQASPVGKELAISKELDKVISENLNLVVTLAEQLSLAISNIKLRETLRNQSIYDTLTQLFNRRYLEETMVRELHKAKRNMLPLAFFMIDIDHFKKFNDTYGHDAGDIILQDFSRCLRNFVRGGDIACRYGGEEFILVLLETTLENALKRAAQLHDAVNQLRSRHQQTILGQITISMGVAIYPIDGDDCKSLICSADAALYQAKNAGRNQTVHLEKKNIHEVG